MERMMKSLLLLVASVMTLVLAIHANDRGKTVYFVPPTGYEYNIDRLVRLADQKEDDFSRAISALKSKLQEAGFDLAVTSGETKLANFAGLIACNFPEQRLRKLDKYPKSKLIFLVTEPATANTAYYQQVYYSHFGKVFTMQDDLVDSRIYHKFYYPIANLSIHEPLTPFGERKLCTLIASKNLVDQPQVYWERSRLIRFFEEHALRNFDLYGHGWDTADYPSYKKIHGPVSELLANYKFCVCFENVPDIKGYVTAKIFDAMKAGCIPVYWGASNITDYVSADCFIDKRDFASDEKLYAFLTGITQERYNAYIARIKEFLDSSRARYFAQESFVDLLFNHLALQPAKSHAAKKHLEREEAPRAEVAKVEDRSLIASIIIGQSSIRYGQNTTLTVLIDGGKPPFYYRWSDGQEGLDMSSITVAPKKATEYTVTVTDNSQPRQQVTSLPFILKVESNQIIKPIEVPVKTPPVSTSVAPAIEYEDEIDDESDEGVSNEPSTEEDYLEEQRENAEMLASLTIIGERVYKNGELIQLSAYPDGLTYRWSGPHDFGAAAQRISLPAKKNAAGTYTLTAQIGQDARSIDTTVTVLGDDQLVTKQPVASVVPPLQQIPVPTAAKLIEVLKPSAAPSVGVKPVVSAPQQVVALKTQPVVTAMPRKLEAPAKNNLLIGRTQNLGTVDDVISFAISAMNASKEKTTNVVLTDTLPDCLELISAGGEGWHVETKGNEIRATLPSLNPAAQKSLVIRARILKRPTHHGVTTKVQNIATLTSDTSVAFESVSKIL